MITYPAVKRLAAWVFLGILVSHASFAGDYNSLILEQIKEMPQGGRYSVSHFAKIRLQSSAHFESGKFFILPSQASPSFCSGATYLVFIRTIETLRATRPAAPRLFHVGAVDHSRSARWRRYLGPMERKRTRHGPSFSRAPAWTELRQLRPSEAGRFHEDFLVAAGGKKRARTFHDFSRHGESPGRPVCPLLVEQYSVWLR